MLELQLRLVGLQCCVCKQYLHDRSLAQVVRRRLSTALIWVRVLLRSYGICGERSGNGGTR
jgi:hypothetical protein